MNFKKILTLSNARWSTRAILVILAFILTPSTGPTLEKICNFICYNWAGFFTGQRYQKLDRIAETLQEGVKLQRHWNPDFSVLDISRSNQCAERSIKVMQELYSICKNKDKLQVRFILSNKH